MVKKIYVFPSLFFLALSGILIFCWFRFGHMYGGGDTGLPTYNPQAAFNITKNIWWDSLAPGIPVAQGLTSAPVLFILSIPQALRASPVFIQALLFFTLLFLMGYGMYLLALTIFGKSKPLLAIAAGVFYLFNPYMMIQIWHRFIHNSIFFVAFLPFLIMAWLWWIRKRNPMYLLLFLLVNFLAVYIYGTIAFIVPVWTLLILLTLLESLVPWKGKKTALSLFFAFLIGLVFWLLTNSWWLIPTFSVSPAIFAEVHTTDDSLSTLISLSASTILPYTLRLINPFYLYWEADFGTSYQNIVFQIISWLFVLVVFIGFIRGLKQKQYVIWSLLFLVVIFLSKGAAPPFNFPYIWGFSHFFPLGVIRNPFEKLGILLPFVYAILFSVGLQYLLITSIKAIGKSKTYFILVIFILLHMAFFWPMFAGKLFGTQEKQNFVEVPASYIQANDWIKKDLGNLQEGRILHLPLSRKEDIIYNWQYGYHGVEPSAAIFTSLPSIARGLDIPGVNDALSGLSLIFHKPNAENNQAVILKMLQDFNVKYIILHKDTEWKKMALEDPEQEKIVLDNLSYLEKKGVYDDLIIYKVVTEYFQPKIIISSNFESVSLNPNRILFWSWIIADTNKDMVTVMDQQFQAQILNNIKGKIIFPAQSSFSRQENSFSGIKQITQFNAPSSGTYELVLTGAQTGGAYLNGFNKLDVLIDGVLNSLTGTIKGQLISFGSLNLNAGSHEIIFLPPESINLFPSFNSVQASENVKLLDNSTIQISASAKNLQFIAGELLKVYGGDVYNISFEYRFAGKKGFYLLMAQDTDPDKMNPALAELNKAESDKWRQYNNILSPLRLNTQKSALEIVFNPETSQILDTQSILQIRNINVERLFNNLVFLRQKSAEQNETPNGSLDNYKRINGGFYEGKLKIIKPALLIFKETYHPGWKLELSENISQGKKFRVENHYLGNLYANAWYIDKPGNYNFKIIFEPQSYVTEGVIIVISSLVGIILLAVYNVLKINRNK